MGVDAFRQELHDKSSKKIEFVTFIALLLPPIMQIAKVMFKREIKWKS